MYRRYGLLAVFLAVSITAQAEQTTSEPLGPPGTSEQVAEQAGAIEAGTEQAAEQAGGIEAATEQASQQGGGSEAQEMTEQAGFSKGSVVRSALTSAVENREPTDKLDIVNTEQQQLYFFTELRDMSGQTAKHRWEHNGKVMAEVEFNVKGPRWRVWSSKSFVPNWIGDWKVSVLNGAGEVIKEETFTYETASASQAAEPATPPEMAIPQQ